MIYFCRSTGLETRVRVSTSSPAFMKPSDVRTLGGLTSTR